MNYFDFNNCGQSFHFFARLGEDIEAFHSDYTLCKGAEFDLTELLENDLPRMHTCPWCEKNTPDTGHMRACSGYKPAPTADEIKDAYSHPTEQSKRDSMLRHIEVNQ